MGRFTRWLGPLPTMLIGCLILAAVFVILGPAPIFRVEPGSGLMWGLQLIFLLGLGLGSAFALLPSMPAMNDHVADGGPRASDAVSGLWCSIWALGSGLGPLVGGAVAHSVGVPWAGFGCAVVMGLCAVGLGVVMVLEGKTFDPVPRTASVTDHAVAVSQPGPPPADVQERLLPTAPGLGGVPV